MRRKSTTLCLFEHRCLTVFRILAFLPREGSRHDLRYHVDRRRDHSRGHGRGLGLDGSHDDLRHPMDRHGDLPFRVVGGPVASVTHIGVSTMPRTIDIMLIGAVGLFAIVVAMAFLAS